MKNYICYLNGVSSCGKTSIAKAMLEKIDEKTIYLSLDNIHENLNARYSNERWELYRHEVYGLHRSANIWYNLGFNVIIDCVLAQKALWEDAIKVLGDSFFVGVFAPLDVVLKREEERGRKDFDLVKRQFNITHQQLDKYSLMIDSTHSSPNELADYVIERLDKEYKGTTLSKAEIKKEQKEKPLEQIDPKPKSKPKPKPMKLKPDLKAAFAKEEQKRSSVEKMEPKPRLEPKPVKLKPDLKAAFKNGK